MGKFVRKLKPTDYWYIGEHESWFSDLAEEGLFLDTMGNVTCRFKKGVPQKMNYRIELTSKKGMSDEQIDFYEDNGWDFVTNNRTFYVFSSPVERQAPEIHTDPAQQAETLSYITSELKFNSIMTGIAALIVIAFALAIWFLDGTPYYALIGGSAIQQTFLVVMMAWTALNTLRGTRAIYQLRKNLIDGIPINHHAPWKRRLFINTVSYLVVFIIFLLVTMIPFYQMNQSYSANLPEGEVDLPIVRLATIEQNDKLVLDVAMTDEIDRGNYYDFETSLFAPKQYQVYESGVIEGEMWLDDSGTYSPAIHTDIYELRLPSLAPKLVDDLVKRSNYMNLIGAYHEIEHPAFDKLVIFEEEGSNEIFAAKNKLVIEVNYYGHKDVDSIVEQLAEVMNK